MQNNFIIKINRTFFNKLNTANLTALSIFLIYFFSITLAPIVKSIISARDNKFIIPQNKNVALRAQILKAKANNIYIVNTVTYINNGQMLSRQIDNNNLQSYINDAKGSVLKLNNSDGTSAQNYSYDAYGNIISSFASPLQRTAEPQQSNLSERSSRPLHKFAMIVENPFQYNGERSDNNTKLQYLRARFYNPETKRFINQDSYDLLNKFGYVDGNSVMGADPSGHDSVGWGDAGKSLLNIIAGSLTSGISVVVAAFFAHNYKLWRGEKEKQEIVWSKVLACRNPNSFLADLERVVQKENDEDIAEAMRSSKGGFILEKYITAMKKIPINNVMPVFDHQFSGSGEQEFFSQKGNEEPPNSVSTVYALPKRKGFRRARDTDESATLQITYLDGDEKDPDSRIKRYCSDRKVGDSIEGYMYKYVKYFSQYDSISGEEKLFSSYSIKRSYAEAYITGNTISVCPHLLGFIYYLAVTSGGMPLPYQIENAYLAVCHFNSQLSFKVTFGKTHFGTSRHGLSRL